MLSSQQHPPASSTWARCKPARKRNRYGVERLEPRHLHLTDRSWNLERAAAARAIVVVTTAYVGSSSRHLQRLYNMNAAGPGDSRTEVQRRMIPSLGAITMTESAGSASYHGLQATRDKRLSRGWQGSLSYAWKSLD